MKVKAFEEIKRVLTEHREELERRYRVKEIGIYGSYVRGEQKESSDLDMIVEFKDEGMDVFEYISLMIDLEEYLEKILGIKPHLASKRHAMNSEVWNTVKKEIVYVFEELQTKNMDDGLEVLTQEEVRKILKKFKREIKEIVGDKFVDLILFGSYARGDYEFGSDIDVLLVVKEELTKEEKDKISKKASETSLKYINIARLFLFSGERAEDSNPFYTKPFLYFFFMLF
jgi:hypothetical protein